ncbi:ABC transporter permease [Ameyamaea chiangmaiensis]|uniref:ABC transporter permease n=2 Tax=Ameyamaea chiangmaiensis TaxID=442969 RepID=A0A850PBA5_9PROT|nr:ABC transporter permease [Ameyamaea chiangmaiensis]MBS4073792.1 ABC transporter permease [Ameyamaea chiangmaiensis]NVN39212.1 ABC transporter permease [Ameyamaea chiangmaiensis]
MVRGIVGPALVLFFVLGLWQGACDAWSIPPYVLPAPTDIGHALWRDAPTLTHALGSTLLVTLSALGLSIVIGSVIAFILVQNVVIERSLMPYVVVMQVTPVVAVAPLIVILVHNTFAALVLCAMLIAIFPVIANTLQGLKSIDPGLADYFRLHRATRWQTLWRLRLPSALPLFLAGVRVSSGLALVGAVVAEFVAGTGGNSAGLAYEILQSGFQMDIPRMFAALFLITLAGLCLFGVTTGVQNRLLGRWMASR